MSQSNTPSSQGTGTARLLSSGTKLSVAGLVASVCTIAFVLWTQVTMRTHYRVTEPMARSALSLRAALSSSAEELQNWIQFGDEEAKHRRTNYWNDEIVPQLSELHQALEKRPKPLQQQKLAKLEELLRTAKYLQWTIEDMAREPLNDPGLQLFLSEVEPAHQRLSIHLENLAYSAAMQTQNPTPGSNPWAKVAAKELNGAEQAEALRASITELVLKSRSLLDDFTPARVVTTFRHIEVVQSAKTAFVKAVGTVDAIGVGKDVEALIAHVQRITQLRESQPASVASEIFAKELAPTMEHAQRLADEISRENFGVLQSSNQLLFRWSFLVLALALIVGALSGTSLYISCRLRDRVQEALENAASVGRYVIEEPIGSGGMGQVFRACHSLLQRPAAIKVLRADKLFDHESQERFQHEVQLTSSLSHPNTVAIYDYGQTEEGYFYYAMELLEGVTLQDLVEICGPQPASRVVHILRQICNSLQEAHKKGLLHRDIKPNNIMLTEIAGIFDFVKVFDFGLALQAEKADEDKNSVLIGTPTHLAPEVIEDATRASPRSDIYALGAVSYFLLTGTRLFDLSDREEILRAQVASEIELPSERLGAHIPEDLEALVMGCLEKAPAERPQSAEAFVALLDEADVPLWSNRDAQSWWETFGETVKTEAKSRGQATDSGLAKALSQGVAPVRTS